jgi:hypothetical protein
MVELPSKRPAKQHNSPEGAYTRTASGKTSRSNRPAFFIRAKEFHRPPKSSLVTLLHCGTFRETIITARHAPSHGFIGHPMR